MLVFTKEISGLQSGIQKNMEESHILDKKVSEIKILMVANVCNDERMSTTFNQNINNTLKTILSHVKPAQNEILKRKKNVLRIRSLGKKVKENENAVLKELISITNK